MDINNKKKQISVTDFDIVEMEFVSFSSTSTQASITYATTTTTATAMGEEIFREKTLTINLELE